MTLCSETCLTVQRATAINCTDISVSYVAISKMMGQLFSCLTFVSKIKIKPCSFTNCLVCKFSILEVEAVRIDFSDIRNPATLFCLRRMRIILVAHPKQKCLAHLLKQFSEMQRLAGASYSRLTYRVIVRYIPSGSARAGLIY